MEGEEGRGGGHRRHQTGLANGSRGRLRSGGAGECGEDLIKGSRRCMASYETI